MGSKLNQVLTMIKTVAIRRIWRNQQGMTLVEILIAATIITVGLVGLMSAVSTGYLDVVASGGQSKATTYARQSLEQIKNQLWCPQPGGVPCSFNPPVAPALTTVTSNPDPDPGYVRTVSFNAIGATPNRLATITVTVVWRNGWERAQTARLQTMRAE